MSDAHRRCHDSVASALQQLVGRRHLVLLSLQLSLTPLRSLPSDPALVACSDAGMRFAINSDSAMAQTWSGGSSGYAWHVPAFTPGVQPKVAVVPTMEDAFFVRDRQRLVSCFLAAVLSSLCCCTNRAATRRRC